VDSYDLFLFFDDAGNEGKPLRFTQEVIDKMRNDLTDAGIDLNLTEETMASLRESQFRNLEQGRGLAIVKIFGFKLAKLLVEYCAYLGEQYGGKRIISSKTGEPIEGTQGRGLQQALADILAIALMPEERDEFERRLNRRIWRWLRKDPENTENDVAIIDNNFSEYGDIPSAKTASVPPRAIGLLWSYIETQI